jgi:hypothetical protein
MKLLWAEIAFPGQQAKIRAAQASAELADTCLE